MAPPDPRQTEARRQPWGDLGLAALFSGAVFVLAHFRALTDPFVINDDVRQQIFWMQQWRDPALFPGDLLADYARHYVPWGVQGLYWLASWVMSPIYFSKVLPGLLFVGLGVCLFEIGRRLGDRALAWTTLGVFGLMPFFLGNLAGGLARAFAAPLLALFWLAWLTRKPRALGLALLLQALFIPYIFLLSAGAAGLAWVAGRLGKDDPPPFPAAWSHWGLLSLAAGLVVLFHLQFDSSGFGPLVSRWDMAQRPEFGPHGRYPILAAPSVFLEFLRPWEFMAPFHEAGIMVGVLVCGVILGVALWGFRSLDWGSLKARLKPAGYLALASLGLYFLARLLLLRLFVPDRYLTYTLNLFYCLALALGLAAGLQVRRWPRFLAVPVVLLVMGLSGLRLQGTEIYDYSAYRPLIAALAQTPKDALMAGHPNLMDVVPTFAGRPALATFELAQPWARGYWQKLEPRLLDLFAAYYADDPQEVIAFCRKYRISFLIVDDRHFTPAFLAGNIFLVPLDRQVGPSETRPLAERIHSPFFAPFDEQIRALTRGRRHFALLSAPLFQPRMVDEHIRLIDMRPWLKN
jgi:hypothetical protein